ncbi:FAD/NAD(P)-binding domain-containing protein [Thozetella sp. PMI_491]|nr:FAD/NAD(P)-binding domain-containing protein [Thozetella sp. PMI_491]
MTANSPHTHQEGNMGRKQESHYSDVVIIGAGFSGINFACQLQRKLGITNYTVYERESGYGGAWFANKYPGCGVDIPAVFYSLSWFPNPDFSSIFPPSSEILRYIRRVALRCNVEPHIRLNTEWKGARWCEETSKWSVYLIDITTGAQIVHEAKVLISAVGGYTNPKYPSWPGMDTFQGTIVHTAQWKDNIDLADRDVIVVGNGCSAAQLVPAIIDNVRSTTQFMRSPQYYVPSPNFVIPYTWRKIFNLVPLVLVLIRWVVFWVLETSLSQFQPSSYGKRALVRSAKKSLDYIRKSTPVERYWHMLTPSYPMGCRRWILDNNYLKCLHRDKMVLTDETIATVQKNSIITTTGKEYPADVIVLATGYAFTQWQPNTVFGRNGISMKEHWDQFGGIEAYRTVAMNEFPNLFYMLGPNSGRGHTSVLFSIECSTELVIKLVRPILQGRVKEIEVTHEAERVWCNTIQGALRKTVLAQSCSSQLFNPKTAWNFFSYPFSSVDFWFISKFPVLSHWVYN